MALYCLQSCTTCCLWVSKPAITVTAVFPIYLQFQLDFFIFYKHTHLSWIPAESLLDCMTHTQTRTHSTARPRVTVFNPPSKFLNSTSHCAQPSQHPTGHSSCSHPLLPWCSRSQVPMVTTLENVKAFFGLFVLTNQPVIRTCSPADTQPAVFSITGKTTTGCTLHVCYSGWNYFSY